MYFYENDLSTPRGRVGQGSQYYINMTFEIAVVWMRKWLANLHMCNLSSLMLGSNLKSAVTLCNQRRNFVPPFLHTHTHARTHARTHTHTHTHTHTIFFFNYLINSLPFKYYYFRRHFPTCLRDNAYYIAFLTHIICTVWTWELVRFSLSLSIQEGTTHKWNLSRESMEQP